LYISVYFRQPGVPPTAGSTRFGETGRVAVEPPHTGLAVLSVPQARGVGPASFGAGPGGRGAWKRGRRLSTHFSI